MSIRAVLDQTLHGEGGGAKAQLVLCRRHELTALPALLSLPIIWLVVSWLYRGRWQLNQTQDAKSPAQSIDDIPFSLPETIKDGGGTGSGGGLYLQPLAAN